MPKPFVVNVHEAKTHLSRLFAHRDPFDRMLAAQSELESLILVTRDPAFDGLGLRLLW